MRERSEDQVFADILRRLLRTEDPMSIGVGQLHVAAMTIEIGKSEEVALLAFLDDE